jgi:hypothetical protein
MCSINHDLKAIFIHTPKCGGLYVEKILERFYNFKTYYFTHEDHTKLFTSPNDTNRDYVNEDNQLQGFLKMTTGGVLRYYSSSIKHNDFTKMTPECWKSYKKIAVIRNPYDRFVSSYLYIKNKLKSNISLNEFIQKKDTADVYTYFHSFINQYDNLIDLNNELHIDYLLNFENLNDELCNALLSIGVPKILHREQLLNNIKINKSSSDNYYKFYDNELINNVNDIFLNDFTQFHYKQVTTVDELKEDSKKYYLTEDQFAKKNIQLLIKLDKTNSIIQLEELDNIINKTVNQVFNNNNMQQSINVNMDNTNVVLDNGLNITVDNTKPVIENTNPYTPKVISNGFMKTLEKMVLKYGGKTV